MKKRKEWLFNILVLCITVLLFFAILEISVRVIIGDNALWEYDSVLGWHHVPEKTAYWCKTEFCHQFTFNSHGFSDDEFVIEKRSDEKRITLFGDSFMGALHVDITNSTHRLLEDKLQQDGIDVNVYNFGTSRYGQSQYLVAMQEFNPTYKPDIIVAVTFIGNDLQDINPELTGKSCQPFHDLVDGKLEQTYYPTDCGPALHERIAKKSLGALFLRRKIITVQKRFQQQTDEDIPVPYYMYDPTHEEFARSFELSTELITEMKRHANQQGAEFILGIIPDDVLLKPEKWEQIKEAYPNMDNIEWDLEYPTKQYKELCQELDLTCIHLKDLFRDHKARTGEKIYFDLDIHMNEVGHHILAEELYTIIKTENKGDLYSTPELPSELVTSPLFQKSLIVLS